MLRRLLPWVVALAGMLQAAHALDPDKAFPHYVRDAWSIDQGLPQISVLALAQDDQGYLWTGTQAGLARFDGVRFVAFNPENTAALPGILTQALLTDRDGTLWIGTYKGVARYARGRFDAVPLASDPAVGLDVRDLHQTAAGTVLVASTSGTFEVRDGALHPLPGAPSLPAFALESDRDGIWIGAEGGAWRLVDDAGSLVELPAQERPATVNRLRHAQGRLWAGTSRGLFERAGDTWQRVPDAPASGPVEAMLEDRDGNFWVAAHGALLRLQQGRVVERVDESTTGGVRAVRALFEDREGSLWLGSQWEGAIRLWNGWSRRYSVGHGLDDPIVWSVARDPDGRLWVGGNDGLSVFDGERFERVLKADQLPHPNAYTLLAEPGTLWIGTRRGLVAWREGRVEMPPEFQPLANLQVNGLLRDAAGRLWIATAGGLYRHTGGELVRERALDGAEDTRVRLLLLRADGRLLVGTQDGLLQHDESGLRRFDGTGLPPALDVTALHELPDGTLLIGTLSEQLLHFDGRRWFQFEAEHGLPVNSPFFLTHDSRGWVWVAGIRGVYRVPLSELMAIRNGRTPRSTRAQMLLSERGDQRGSQKGYCCNGAGNGKGFIERDTLWLPTRGGVVTLNSSEVGSNETIPPVVIERLRHSGAWHAVLPGVAPVLPRGARDLGFEFTTLSFQQPASIGMRYRLRGYDTQWHALADPLRRDATYTNLPPGDYVFEVAGANNALRWNPVSAQLPFHIAPRLHETVWFHALAALLVVGSGIALWRVQTRQLRQQRLELASQVAARTADLADANRQLHEMSHTDALTGLRNRRFLQAQLPADLAFYLREVRKPGNEGSVMMLAVVDIDHFKLINDRHGHRAGDLVLQQFSRLLERQVRSGDYVVRWGGEEFLLVFRPMPFKEATKIAERVRQAVERYPFEIEAGDPLRVTASIGFVEYPLFRETHPVPDWERMVELADLALYAVKRSGRNGWATYRATRSMPLESLLDELRLGVEAALAGGTVELLRSPPSGNPPQA